MCSLGGTTKVGPKQARVFAGALCFGGGAGCGSPTKAEVLPGVGERWKCVIPASVLGEAGLNFGAEAIW